MKPVICAASFLILISGCAETYKRTTQLESSGLIGCHPDEITIEKTDFSGLAWTASCKNTKFYCSKTKEIISCTKTQ